MRDGDYIRLCEGATSLAQAWRNQAKWNEANNPQLLVSCAEDLEALVGRAPSPDIEEVFDPRLMLALGMCLGTLSLIRRATHLDQALDEAELAMRETTMLLRDLGIYPRGHGG